MNSARRRYYSNFPDSEVRHLIGIEFSPKTVTLLDAYVDEEEGTFLLKNLEYRRRNGETGARTRVHVEGCGVYFIYANALHSIMDHDFDDGFSAILGFRQGRFYDPTPKE